VVKPIPTSILQFCCVYICLPICSTFSIVLPFPSHSFQHLMTLFTTSDFYLSFLCSFLLPSVLSTILFCSDPFRNSVQFTIFFHLLCTWNSWGIFSSLC
jgi:hypothetical protein